MYCVKCGGELAGGASFCKFCGSPQAGGGAAPGGTAAASGGPGPAGAGDGNPSPGSSLTTRDYIVMGALMALALLLILIFAVS